MNNYYCMGHKWTERSNEGKFISTQINSNIFMDGYEDENGDEDEICY